MKSDLKQLAKNILVLLKKAYPDSKCSLVFSNPLEILVATILSAQCTDTRVNLVTPALFRKFKSCQDYANADLKVLQSYIRSTGFYKNKAKNIQGACRVILKNFKGEIPKNMEQILTLPGVARKTANVVLGNAYAVIEGIAVDTHVKRLSRRLGLSRQKTPEKIEKDLIKIVPKADWMKISYLLIDHGRKICKAVKPNCAECVLKKICPSAFSFNIKGKGLTL